MSQMFYYAQGDQRLGPVPIEQLGSLGVGPQTLVWTDGMTDWVPAQQVPALQAIFAPQMNYAAPPYVPPNVMPPAGPVQYANYGTHTSTEVPGQGQAIASMVLGIFSILMLCAYGIGAIIGIVAVVLGHKANALHRGATGRPHGMATAGLVTGYIGISVGALWLAFIAFFLIVAARG